MSAPGAGALRVGIVGGGRWAGVHREALRSLGVPLARVLVRSEASATRLRAAWDVVVDTDPAAFFAAGLDAVIVASPNYLHARHAKQALHAGAHVLVEKPMAITLEDCDALLAEALAAGRVLAVGHEMRLFRLFEAVREEAAVLGPPLHLDLRLFRRPYRSGASGWKQDPTKLGSSILEEPIHYLDLARWYLGEVVSLQAWTGRQVAGRAAGEPDLRDLDIRLEFESGASALVTRSIRGFEHHVRLDMSLEGGALRAHWDGTSDMDEEPDVGLVVGDGSEVRAVDVGRRTGHAFELPRQTAAFLAAILDADARGPKVVPAVGSTIGSTIGPETELPTGVPKGLPTGLATGHATGEDGRAAVALCLAAERSVRQGSVRLDLRSGQGETAEGGEGVTGDTG